MPPTTPHGAGATEFLSAPGETAALLREHDWTASSLGAPENWPQPLKTLVGVILGSSQPMFVVWGPERTLVYNDAYSTILARKHPSALCRDFLEVWHEIRADLRPIVARTYAGESVHMDDIELVMERRGYPEETHFSFFYAPVRDEAGNVAGLYCACNEITGQVLGDRRRREAEAALRDERDRARRVLDGMAEGFGLLDRDFRVLDINAEGLRLDRRRRDEIIGKTHWEAWPGTEDSELGRLYKRAMADRVAIDLVHRYVWPDGHHAWLEMRGYPTEDGLAIFWRDVTERKQAEERERGSQARFRLMADAVPQIVWITDAHGNAEFFNKQWADYTGDAYLPNTAAEVAASHVHPDDAAPTMHAFNEARRTGGSFSVEHRIRSRSGEYRWFLVRGEPYRSPESGAIVKWFGASVDIHDRKLMEAAYRESEARLGRALEAGELGAWELNLASQRMWRSPQHDRVFGYETPRAEWTYAMFLDHVVAEDRERVDGAFKAAVGGGERWDVECRVRRADGAQRWISVQGRVERDAAGAAVSVKGMVRDITERRAVEDRLRDLNETLEAQVAARAAERDRLWNLSQDMLARADYSGMMSAVSPAWGQTLGWTETELLTRGYATFMHPADMPPTLEALARMGETRLPTRFENRIATSDGGWKNIEWTVAPEPDGVNFIAVGRDVTMARTREAELEAAQEALRQSQKMEAVGQLTGGIAHDFNNLLAVISGGLQVTKMKLARGQTHDLVRHIDMAEASVRRAAALTQRLLAFSRRQTLDPKSVNLNRMVGGMEDLIRRTVGPSIDVEVVREGALWATRVDPSQLENVLLNLCINARDAMLPLGGRLTVQTANRWLDERAAAQRELPPGQYVTLCVTDTGTGIEPEVLKRIFDPFFTTKPLGQGTGLGLSMVYGFARQSGGHVAVHTELGHGTTMCLYLPRHADEAEEDAPVPSASVVSQSDGETVVVLEDEDAIRALIADVLEEAGYRVLQAADGPTALRILQAKGRIDLLLSDVGLPGGLNGRQVADAGRALRRELKVLFLTGYAENVAVGNGLMESGMQVMTKPFDVQTLTEKVQDMLMNDGPSTAGSASALN